MTKLEIFNRLIELAKSRGYEGPDFDYELGKAVEGTNAYSVFFRQDFSKAIWGSGDISYNSKTMPKWQVGITKLALSEDKWKFLENNVLID
jgi:hypothetical protein